MAKACEAGNGSRSLGEGGRGGGSGAAAGYQVAALTPPSPSYSSANKAHTQSCSISRYPTLDATPLRYIVENQCGHNCSTLNLKLILGCAYLTTRWLHCKVRAELGPRCWRWEGDKTRPLNAGASMRLTRVGERGLFRSPRRRLSPPEHNGVELTTSVEILS